MEKDVPETEHLVQVDYSEQQEDVNKDHRDQSDRESI
jgi:hypothetical protein